MIEKELWMPQWIGKLKDAFESRLLYVGLQGSYQRDEQKEDSDFDVMVILKDMATEDLKIYRELLATMPDSEIACGFICGDVEMKHWPAHEIFQLTKGTQDYFGVLANFVPVTTMSDLLDSIHISAGNLYHAASHIYIYNDEQGRIESLRGCYKEAFFVLQLVEYLRSGNYWNTRKELQEHLLDTEWSIMEVGTHWESYTGKIKMDEDHYFGLLIQWCKKILKFTPEVTA